MTTQTCELCNHETDRLVEHESRGPVAVCEICIQTERFQILCDCPYCGKVMDAGENFPEDRCCAVCAQPALTVGQVHKVIATLEGMKGRAVKVQRSLLAISTKSTKAAGLQEAINLLVALLDK